MMSSLFAVQRIRQIEIDETVVRTVKLFPQYVTTIMFPSKNGIESIQGANVTKNISAPAGFYIEYSSGSNVVSVRPMDKAAKGSLNIVYKKRIIVIQLETTNVPDEGEVSISFVEPKNEVGKKKPQTTPSVLVNLLDMAKGFELYKKYHPEALANVTSAKLEQVSVFSGFDVVVSDAFRFEKQDTVILRMYLKNKTNDPIEIDRESFAVRVGSTLIHASITDAVEVLPSGVTTIAYAGFTGTPSGARNNLAPENEWKILVSTGSGLKNKIELDKLKILNNSLSGNLAEEDLKAIEGQIEVIR